MTELMPRQSTHNRSALYMLWDPHASEVVPTVARSYEIITVAVDDVDALRDLAEAGEPTSDSAWAEFVDRLLPDGMFVARHVGTGVPIGTVSVIHNPRASRFHFPGGGAIACLAVDPQHRGHRLGSALVAHALGRVRRAGYHTVWLAVEEWRLPAIVTYLDVGFMPFLHSPAADVLAARWTDVFRQIGRAANPERWARPDHLQRSASSAI